MLPRFCKSFLSVPVVVARRQFLRSLSSFTEAVQRSTSLPQAPSNEHKLRLYALYKQATTGPNTTPQPSLLDMVGRAKWSAWSSVSALSKVEAESEYVQLVSSLGGGGGQQASPSSSTPTTPSAPAFTPKGAFRPLLTGPMLPPGTFAGKVAFVTGGGTGLGRAMATRLASLGATVGISSRKAGVLESAAKEMREATKGSGGDIIPLPADVRDPAAIAGALDALESQGGKGPATLCINNAAGNFVSPYERLSPNAIKTVLEIVLHGTAFVTLEAGKRMIAGGKGGVFLNITTTYAPDGSGYVVPSAAAKAGVHALTGSLAAEWGAKYGIRFVALAPGPIETEGAFSRLDPTGQFKALLTDRLPAQRLGDPGELANLATYLLSDYAAWMTGQVVTLDGGEKSFMSGEFNALNQVTPAMWDQMEALIRKGNAKKE
jgi:2,4-dienoyl-CoA reductase